VDAEHVPVDLGQAHELGRNRRAWIRATQAFNAFAIQNADFLSDDVKKGDTLTASCE